VTLPAGDNFRITADRLREKITPRTKAVMVNSPNNPTGRVITGEEMDALVSVVLEHDLYVISDEIYETVIFDGRKHLSPAARPGMAERTLTVNGVSKSHAMTGWRLGWLAGPTPIMKLATQMNSQTVSSAANFTMHAAVAALTGPKETTRSMCEAYRARRDFMVPALNAIDGVECLNIEGAFYLFPRFPNSTKNSAELAAELIDKAGIASVPGGAFGKSGEGHVRFTIATAMGELERAVEKLSSVAAEL
jgi:aspartate aminotransferase